MDPPSLDPPPDSDYPGFAADHEDRRTLIFIGANDGMMHAIDGRTGVEVWAYIPFNLLPKLRTLRDGQGIDGYAYYVDTSAKVADVKIGGTWRTMVTFGEGIGGTFYQALDASLDDMAASVSPDSDSVSALLSYFNNTDRIKYLWAFPRYSVFDTTINTTAMPYGDVASSASADEKSVGQTWSDPAVGEIKDTTGPYTIIVGSGFLPRSVENGSTRGGATAGQKLYLLSAEDGHAFASSSVGNDGLGETDDDCTAMSYGCTKFKNAIQADPVATGPSDSRFVTKAYVGDLDGKVWRFNLDLDSSKNPMFTGSPLALYTPASSAQPIFSSMAAVSVGTQEYLFVGTGSDLLPSVGVSVQYQLLGILDQGSSGAKKFQIDLSKVDGTGDDEKVSSFPAVAGDIVFFSTTSFKPTTPCSQPDANLYALTFIGGAAYDSTGDNKVSNGESPKVRSLAGAGRATAPFIVDQHLAFGAGNKIELLGDPADFNNGVGDVGVRILSWRDIR
jgi:Tfp pilus tip-associated adhesin PilY1